MFLIWDGFTTREFVVYLLHTVNFIAGKLHFLQVGVSRQNADVTQLTTLGIKRKEGIVIRVFIIISIRILTRILRSLQLQRDKVTSTQNDVGAARNWENTPKKWLWNNKKESSSQEKRQGTKAVWRRDKDKTILTSWMQHFQVFYTFL